MINSNSPLTVEEAAKILKVSKYTLYDLIKEGKIPAQRIGRQLRINPANLSNYISNNSLTMPVVAPYESSNSSNNSDKQTPTSMRFVGSHDPIVELLATFCRHSTLPFELSLGFKGSMEGLIALYRREADFTGIHLWDDKTDEYNLPFVHYVLPGASITIVNLLQRIQGFIVQPGNPFNIQSWEDIIKPDLRFINRQKGSGTRLRTDAYLQTLKISPAQIHGYESEENTHFGVASKVANDGADVGIGVQAAAHQLGLDFVPLFKERYDLIVRQETISTTSWQQIFSILNSSTFHKAINRQIGYDTSLTGKILY